MHSADGQSASDPPAFAAIAPEGRYVVLRHEMPAGADRPTHWDFMLEAGPVLRTWALDHAPADGQTTPALALADHRTAYLTYEGPVSGDRGQVSRWDAGTFVLCRSDAAEIVVQLSGSRLKGRAALTPDGDQRWRFSFIAEPT